MGKFHAYPEYQDSGAYWLGKIPAEWNVQRIKFAAELINEKTAPTESDHYIGLENVSSGTGRFVPSNELVLPEGVSNRYYPGMILFGKLRPYLAKSLRVYDSGICSSEFLVLCPKNATSPFLHYYTLTDEFIKQVDSSTYGTRMPRASWDFIGSLPMPIPSMEEQKVITTFLDYETERIDLLIARQDLLIGLLKEKRKAVISHAVTKGLNHDAPMKDSGVDWLGDVPAQWETARLRFVVEGGLANGLFKKKKHFGKGTLLVNVFDIYQEDFVIKPDLLERVAATKEEEKAYQVKPGDIFFVRSSLKLEGVGRSSCAVVVPEPMVFECHLVRARPKKIMMSPSFMNYFLNSTQAVSRLVSLANFVTMATVDQEKIKGVNIPIPPLNDQDEICDYLDRKVQVFDELVNKTGVAVVLLKEHRIALISAAVTGKIDVRGWKTPNTESEKIAKVVSA